MAVARQQGARSWELRAATRRAAQHAHSPASPLRPDVLKRYLHL
jgi:hypothetical protein